MGIIFSGLIICLIWIMTLFILYPDPISIMFAPLIKSTVGENNIEQLYKLLFWWKWYLSEYEESIRLWHS